MHLIKKKLLEDDLQHLEGFLAMTLNIFRENKLSFVSNLAL